jgi:hypothetical protein
MRVVKIRLVLTTAKFPTFARVLTTGVGSRPDSCDPIGRGPESG